MSEDPAPYWVSRPEPMPRLDGQGWCATVSWRDVATGHELRWHSETNYETWAEALLAACEAEADEALLERLLAEHPRDMEAYWRKRTPWLYAPQPPRVDLPCRPFAEWERDVFGRLTAGSDQAVS